MITAEGRGEADPVGDNKTKEGSSRTGEWKFREQVK